MDMDMNSISTKIIELRESHGLSQAQLARKMGLNKNVMGRIEHENRTLRADEIVKLAKIFDVSTDFILDHQVPATAEGELLYQQKQERDQLDIAKKVQELIDLTENEPDLNFYGAPMSQEHRKLLANALEIGLQLSYKKAHQEHEN